MIAMRFDSGVRGTLIIGKTVFNCLAIISMYDVFLSQEHVY